MNLLADFPAVNGVQLKSSDEVLDEQTLRQRVCTELLRQAAISSGLLDSTDPQPVAGATSAAANDAIERLLATQVVAEAPDKPTCERYYLANQARFAIGERVQARHVLFAVTPGVDVAALRQRAEACLVELRCEKPGSDAKFPQAAASLSNCPSGEAGGSLGWLTESDCAPEFARELFGKSEIGVLPTLVHSRFGLHVVEVLAREPGMVPAFETVGQAVAGTLERQAFATGLRRYLQELARSAVIRGVDFDQTP
ncbi:MAG: peptidylprolyl isomerase [Burkholderiaceae bacterium]